LKRFIGGADRNQVMLLPDSVEDYVGPDNPVRVVDAFVEQLDLRGGGFPWRATATDSAFPCPAAKAKSIHFSGVLRRELCLLATAGFGIPPLKSGAELIIEDVDPHLQY
jgi:hypothetical protein